MPDTMRVKRRSMWSSAMKLSGRITRSTDEWEMSRSCQSALFSNDAVDREGGTSPDVPGGIFRHEPGAGHRVDRGNLNLQPGFVFPLVAPDATHLRARVSADHLRGFFSLTKVVLAEAPVR